MEADLRERLGSVERVDDDGGTPMFALGDLPAGEIEGTSVPVTLSFATSDGPPDGDALAAAARQTWDWEEARSVVDRVGGGRLVLPMVSWAWLDRRLRLEVVHAGVEALLAQGEPLALHWPSAERLVAPDTYRRGRASDDDLYPAVNVRLFRVEDGAADQLFMDTLGLHVLGLRDLEIRYSDLEPGEVASQLGSIGRYLFDEGDVIGDGDTVEGVPAGTAWRAAHAVASLPPEREVVAFAPAGW